MAFIAEFRSELIFKTRMTTAKSFPLVIIEVLVLMLRISEELV